MEKVFFKIIIPNFNSEEWIEKCINSILSQSFTDYKIIIIDDMSTDNSLDIIKNFTRNTDKICLLESDKKLWNGGARNAGIHIGEIINVRSQYILFVDDDDWINSNDCLQKIYETITKNNYPDCVRLSYYYLKDNVKLAVELNQNTPKDLVNSVYIAPWTKCIKSDLVVDFPENTLIEDVAQHIAQCDNIETIAVCDTPIIVWNRNNKQSTSLEENKHFYNGKRISSVYRNIADLMDLQCKHDYCEEHRKWRIECYKNMIKEGKEGTF